MSRRLTLVLGGQRAGKSSYAQRLAEESGGSVLFVATAEALDDEMSARILKHQQDRPSEWDTLEEPLDLVSAMSPIVDRYQTVLLDCLTLWVSNLMLSEPPRDVLGETRRLLECYRAQDASWIVVSNEVGLGTIPANKLARDYSEELGRVNQLVAAAADEVIFMAAGLPLTLKSRETGG